MTTTFTPSPRSSNADRTGIRQDYYRQRRKVGGVLVSTLLGTDGHPEHGTAGGADWYGCGCGPCRRALNSDDKNAVRREVARRRRVELGSHREPVDGVLVSTLLGTDEHPDHGTFEGYSEYLCRCERCTRANRENMRRYRQRYSPAGKAAAAVLGPLWPGQPAHGAVNELAGTLADRWQAVRRDQDARQDALASVLAEHPAWTDTTADHRADVAAQLVSALAAPRSR